MAPLSVDAAAVECGDTGVAVTAPGQAEAEHACEAVEKAVSFLGAHELHNKGRISVELVTELPADRVREGMLACYSHLNSKIHVLTLSSCYGVQDPFDLKIDRVQHQGMIAHEVAHAVAAGNFIIDEPSSVAQEYIAYVTHLAVLPADRRQRILSQFPGDEFRPDFASNLMLLLMDPGRFAARAYRHFMQPENGSAFFRRVLAGEILNTDVAVMMNLDAGR